MSFERIPVTACLLLWLVALAQGQDDLNRDVTADTLLFTTIRTEPFVVLEESPEGLFRFAGFMVDLWEAVNQALEQPFEKYIFQPVADNMYGQLYGNGTWSGMIGEVVNGRADAAMAPLAVTARRQTAVDFTEPFLQTSLAVLVRKQFDITSIEQLMRSKQVQYGTYDKSHSLVQLFVESEDPLLKQMHKSMKSQEPSVFVSTTAQGLERVLTEDYAFIGGSDTLEYLAIQNCDLMTFTFGEYQNYSIALERGGRFTEDFSQAIQMLRLNGTIQNLYKKWWNRGDVCMPSATEADMTDHGGENDDETDSGAERRAGLPLLMSAGIFYSLVCTM